MLHRLSLGRKPKSHSLSPGHPRATDCWVGSSVCTGQGMHHHCSYQSGHNKVNWSDQQASPGPSQRNPDPCGEGLCFGDSRLVLCLTALHRQAQAMLASLRPGVRFGFHYCDDTSSSNLARDEGPHTGSERPPCRGHGAPGHGSGEVLESLVFGAESIEFHFHAGVL